MAKLSFKERERLRREQEILLTAARHINAHGYSRLNMDEVAEDVGVSKPTLYQHFKSKDEMVIGTMIESADQLLAHMESHEDEAPLIRLEKTMRYLLDSHLQTDVFPATFVHEPTLMTHERYQDLIQRRRTVGDALESIFKTGQTQGQIPESIPSIVLTSSLFAMVGVLRSREVMPHDQTPPEAIAEGIVQLFLHGISGQA